jgi:hypothetical protein
VYDRKVNDACSDNNRGFFLEVLSLVDALLEALCELVPTLVVCVSRLSTCGVCYRSLWSLDLVIGDAVAMKSFPLLRLASRFFETTTIRQAASTNGSVVGPLRDEVLRAFS